MRDIIRAQTIMKTHGTLPQEVVMETPQTYGPVHIGMDPALKAQVDFYRAFYGPALKKAEAVGQEYQNVVQELESTGALVKTPEGYVLDTSRAHPETLQKFKKLSSEVEKLQPYVEGAQQRYKELQPKVESYQKLQEFAEKVPKPEEVKVAEQLTQPHRIPGSEQYYQLVHAGVEKLPMEEFGKGVVEGVLSLPVALPETALNLAARPTSLGYQAEIAARTDPKRFAGTLVGATLAGELVGAGMGRAGPLTRGVAEGERFLTEYRLVEGPKPTYEQILDIQPISATVRRSLARMENVKMDIAKTEGGGLDVYAEGEPTHVLQVEHPRYMYKMTVKGEPGTQTWVYRNLLGKEMRIRAQPTAKGWDVMVIEGIKRRAGAGDQLGIIEAEKAMRYQYEVLKEGEPIIGEASRGPVFRPELEVRYLLERGGKPFDFGKAAERVKQEVERTGRAEERGEQVAKTELEKLERGKEEYTVYDISQDMMQIARRMGRAPKFETETVFLGYPPIAKERIPERGKQAPLMQPEIQSVKEFERLTGIEVIRPEEPVKLPEPIKPEIKEIEYPVEIPKPGTIEIEEEGTEPIQIQILEIDLERYNVGELEDILIGEGIEDIPQAPPIISITPFEEPIPGIGFGEIPRPPPPPPPPIRIPKVPFDFGGSAGSEGFGFELYGSQMITHPIADPLTFLIGGSKPKRGGKKERKRGGKK